MFVHNFDHVAQHLVGDWIFDVECYPNVFTISLSHLDLDIEVVLEISDRVNELPQLMDLISAMKAAGTRMVGFNNVGYDYPLLHWIIEHAHLDIGAAEIYGKSCQIINTPFDNRFSNIVWERDRHITQVDLFMINHFDNVARSTSLKVLEFNMRSLNIEDLPYKPGTVLTSEQIDNLIRYNRHDVKETRKFYFHTLPMLRFRDELTEKLGMDCTNFNDTKIGKQYFIQQLEEKIPGSCYDMSSGKKVIRQTPRPQIHLRDVIFDYVKFDHPEFNRILNWFKSQTITETKGVFKDIHCTIDGFQFDFGVGGIHGSIDSQIVESDDDWIIEDWDVASYYPNLAIANNLYPAHLGTDFCTIYEDVYQQRKGHAKGTAENAMLKLALNGVYGDSNSKYSPFYDPQYTMSITINGQLLLCMLADQLMKCPGLRMIQINTDGLTVRYQRRHKNWVHALCNWWENITRLELEDVEYNRMFIRDVNNYIGEYTDGKVKRKGAYEYDLAWHQNQSSIVVAKAAEAALLHGEDIEHFIKNHDDIYDFMLRAKVPRSSRLVIADRDGEERQIQNVTRYYVSGYGGPMTKIMPPTPSQVKKNPDAPERRIGICAGQYVTECNDITNADRDDINFNYYINEAYKLVNPLRK